MSDDDDSEDSEHKRLNIALSKAITQAAREFRGYRAAVEIDVDKRLVFAKKDGAWALLITSVNFQPVSVFEARWEVRVAAARAIPRLFDALEADRARGKDVIADTARELRSFLSLRADARAVRVFPEGEG